MKLFLGLSALLVLGAGTSAEAAIVFTLDANTGAWNFELGPGDAFVASAPPDNQEIAWGSGTSFSQSDFDFNAGYGPDYTGGDPSFSGTAQANILTTGNELTGFQMIGPWDWEVSIVFFQITFAPNFDTGFIGPANGSFNTTVGQSSEPLTVNVTPVPEPSAAGLLGLALGALAWRRRCRAAFLRT